MDSKTMEIIRHPGYVEIKLPEFFELDPRIDNLTRIFSAVQPGTHNLLLNLTGGRTTPRKRDENDRLHFSRALQDAFNSITVELEMIAFLTTGKMKGEVTLYAEMLENAGFDVKVFTDRGRAVGWVGY